MQTMSLEARQAWDEGGDACSSLAENLGFLRLARRMLADALSAYRVITVIPAGTPSELAARLADFEPELSPFNAECVAREALRLVPDFPMALAALQLAAEAEELRKAKCQE